jgi:hypothetical protein
LPHLGPTASSQDASFDYGPVFLLKPFGFHLAMNTLSSKTIVLATEALPPPSDMTPLIREPEEL